MAIKRDGSNKNGEARYRVRVDTYDKHGKRVQKEKIIYGKREAERVEREMKAAALGQPDEAGGMTIKELAADYINGTRYDVRESTLDKTAHNLEQQIIPYLGNVKLRNLTTQLCREWKNTISDKRFAIKTRQNLYSTFNALLNYAVQQDYIRKNPLSVLGTFKDVDFDSPENKALHYYTADEFGIFSKVLLDEALEKDNYLAWGLYIFFMFAFFTGMRKGEINSLRWKDIDGNIIRIRRSVGQKLKGEDRITPPKNISSMRDIAMPAQLMQALEEHRARWMNFTGFSEDLFICGGPRSLRDTTIDKANRRTAEKAGLPHIRIHDFRHSHASLLCNAGVNIQEISRRLGHASVTETWRTYSHMYPSEESRVLNVLEGCGKPKDEEKSKDGDKSKNEEKSESSTTSA